MRYVYFASIGWFTGLLAGCAFGVTPDQELPHDGGILHADGGAVKDAKAPTTDAGVEDSAVDPPDVPETTQCTTLPLPTGIPACDTCLAGSCCAEDQACGFDQDCMAFNDCVEECFPDDGGPLDQECESLCEAQYPNGSSELFALDECLQDSCATDCEGP